MAKYTEIKNALNALNNVAVQPLGTSPDLYNQYVCYVQMTGGSLEPGGLRYGWAVTVLFDNTNTGDPTDDARIAIHTVVSALDIENLSPPDWGEIFVWEDPNQNVSTGNQFWAVTITVEEM